MAEVQTRSTNHLSAKCWESPNVCPYCGGQIKIIRVERGLRNTGRLHRCWECGEVFSSTQSLDP